MDTQETAEVERALADEWKGNAPDVLRLREWRESMHLSQRELASMAGLALSTVNDLETGKREPNWKTLRKLSGAFEAPVGALRYPPTSDDAATALVFDALRSWHVLATDYRDEEGAELARRVVNHLRRTGHVDALAELQERIDSMESFLGHLRDELGSIH